MKKKSLGILYTNPLFAEGIAKILGRQKILKVGGLFSRSGKSKRQIRTHRINLLIVEGGNPLVDAFRTLRWMLKQGKEGSVISVNLDYQEAVLCMGVRMAATEQNLIEAVKASIYRNRKKGFRRKEENDEDGENNV